MPRVVCWVGIESPCRRVHVVSCRAVFAREHPRVRSLRLHRTWLEGVMWTRGESLSRLNVAERK